MLPDLRFLIERLVEREVRFVVIGGVALVLRGSARTTQDLDLERNAPKARKSIGRSRYAARSASVNIRLL